MERIVSQGITFLISLFISRILSPDDYGVIALVTILTTLFSTIVSSGFNTSLLQKLNPKEEDYSSVFILMIAISIVLYTITYLISPLLALLYKNEKLTIILKVMALRLPLSAISSILQTHAIKSYNVKSITISTLISSIISGVIAIIIALNKLGPWSLVAQNLSFIIIQIFILVRINMWMPKIVICKSNVKYFLKIGSKLTIISMINVIYNDINNFIIGKVFSMKDLGLYNRGKSFPYIIAQNVNSAIPKVLLNTMSEYSNDKEELKKILKKAIQMDLYIVMPIMLFLFVNSHNIIVILLNENWLASIPHLQLMAIGYIFMIQFTIGLEVFNAIKRTDIYIKINILRMTIGIFTIIILIIIKKTAIVIGIAFITETIITNAISMHNYKKVLNYLIKDQIKDLYKIYIVSITMGAIIIIFNKILRVGEIYSLFIQFFIAFVVYIGLSKIFLKNIMYEFKSKIRILIKRG